jgi:hypothetical protein
MLAGKEKSYFHTCPSSEAFKARISRLEEAFALHVQIKIGKIIHPRKKKFY